MWDTKVGRQARRGTGNLCHGQHLPPAWRFAGSWTVGSGVYLAWARWVLRDILMPRRPRGKNWLPTVRRPLQTTFDMTTLIFSAGGCPSYPFYSFKRGPWYPVFRENSSREVATKARTPQRGTPPDLKTKVDVSKVDVKGFPTLSRGNFWLAVTLTQIVSQNWKGGKDPHPQDFSLTKKTARFTLRANFVLTKDRKRPYCGHFCGKMHSEGSCSKAAGGP